MFMAGVEWPRENREFNVSNRVEMLVCAAEFNKENRKSRASQTTRHH